MTLSKKEKTMIFVLLIVMAVGGFYVYGITPQNNNIEKLEADKTALQTQIQEAEDVGSKYEPSVVQRIIKAITANRELLASMAAPGVNVNDEIISGNLPDTSSSHAVAYGMIAYLSKYGLTPSTDISMANKTEQNGKIIYNYSTSYKCSSMNELLTFIDACAQHTSYYISNLTVNEVTNGGVKSIEGNISIVITYTDI